MHASAWTPAVTRAALDPAHPEQIADPLLETVGACEERQNHLLAHGHGIGAVPRPRSAFEAKTDARSGRVYVTVR